MADLDLAAQLLAAGIPVIAVGPNDIPRQRGWQDLTAAECDLSLYRRGDALAMVGGHGIDAVDVDPKNGGDVDNLPPFKSYGETTTPSGGKHYIVPSSGFGKITPLRTDLGLVGDYVGGRPDGSGRLLLFLPGSVRTKYPNGGYVETALWDVEGCLAATCDPDLVTALEKAGGGRESGGRDHYVYDGPDRDPALGIAPAAKVMVESALDQLQACDLLGWDGPPWDQTTYNVACSLVELGNSGWTGYDLDDLNDLFLAHAPSDGEFGPASHAEKWASAVARVGDGGVRERTTAAEDFEPLEDEEPEPEVIAERGGSWRPVDLGATLDGLLSGELTRYQPTLGTCETGEALFYAGKVNGIAGASGSGKSWAALLTAAQEVVKGEHVVYVDLEDDALGVVGRLLDLKLDADALRSRFHYVRPEESYTDASARAMAEALTTFSPTLVVIDSTGESMAMDGSKPNDDDDTARWFRRLPTAIAAKGPAVVVLDHVVKADDGGLWPIGSQRKRAAISGAQYMQQTVRPFDKTTAGSAKLVCAKDRHGNYRVGMTVAEMTVGPDAPELVRLVAAVRHQDNLSDHQEVIRQRVADFLSELPEGHEGASRAFIVKEVKGNTKAIDDALFDLLRDGFVEKRMKGQSNLHRLVKSYLPDFGESA